jgi:hypothetical protein
MTRQDIEDLKSAVELVTKTAVTGLTTIKQFIEGEHWQGGAGWIGPRPQPGETGAGEVMAELERAFTSSNRILEVCDRHAAAVTGREPTWTLAPRDAEEDPEKNVEEVLEVNTALTQWWNKRGVPTLLHDAVVAKLWGKRAVLRLYIPQGVREDPALISADSLEAALDLIWVEVVPADRATVHVDPDSKRELGIVLYKDDEDNDVVELTYLDETRESTLVEVLRDEGGGLSEPLAMGGRITMFELTRDRPFVTPQLLQQQRAHNLALSMLPRNLVTGGFLERVILNAQMPGVTVVDKDTGEETFVPGKLQLGAGKTAFIEGIRTTDQQTGKDDITSPSVHWRDPVPVDSSVDGARATYSTMLEETRQSFVLMNTVANASGKSRIEARRDFDTSLKPTRLETEMAGRWMMEAVLSMAENFYGSPGQYTERYRIDFTCAIDPGTATPEERQQNARDVEAGIIPKEFAQRAAGIDDTDASQALIDSEPESQLRVLQKRAAIVRELTSAGASLDTAAEVAGFEPDMIALLKRSMTFGLDEDEGRSEDGAAEETEAEAE